VIRRLEIRGLVVIEEADLEPGPGLTAITGETGAGKSVLLQSLELLAGAPADASLVRPGHRHALVQATLALPEDFWDRLDDDDPAAALRDVVDEPDEVTVTRRIPREGRARAFVDGQAVTRDAVASLVRHRVRFSGQGEQRRLLSPARQIAILDAHAGEEVAAMARRLEGMRRALRRLDRDIAGAAARRAETARRRAELEEMIDVVERVAPDEAELAALRAERERLRHADRLIAGAAAAAEAVSPEDGEGGAAVAVGAALGALAGLAALDPQLAPAEEHLAAADAALQEAGIALRAYLGGVEAEPGRLEAVEDRIDEHVRLERRFGLAIPELRERVAQAHEDLAALERGDHDDAGLAARREELVAGARTVAAELHARRVAACAPLEEAVSHELAALAIAEAALRIEVTRDDDEVPRDRCVFLFRPNPGLPEAPLAEGASGGELSRVLLALSSVAAASDDATWVFDEIDAGIGGRTATAVAERLAHVGRSRQLLVITHSPQLAARAEWHLRLDKVGRDGEISTTGVQRLEGEDLVVELCRMLGAGAGDDTARRHAEALLARAGA